MSIQGGGSGRSVFLRRQQLLQFRKLGSPRRFVRVKGICQTTPANIAGQYLLLLRRGLPGGLLQMLQQLDRRDIGLVLGLGAALAQMVVTDMEILGVAAQVVFVLLVGRLLSRPLVGKGLPMPMAAPCTILWMRKLLPHRRQNGLLPLPPGPGTGLPGVCGGWPCWRPSWRRFFWAAW